MSVFEKWAWIKRNWTYIVEEASQLDLVFVGGTALNLALFEEYRASEDIDLYDPNSNNIGTDHEEKMAEQLSQRLLEKGFEIKSRNKHTLWIGPNIKVDVFNNGTIFNRVEKKIVEQAEVLLFDLQAYADMKMRSLLCRSTYDARDLVDLFVIQKETDSGLSFPQQECEVIEQRYNERLQDIKKTKKEGLLVFQTRNQVAGLPYDEFDDFRRRMYEWLSGFR
ncbi:MAG: nucleotidyl transferase AbiEii/AbiGii toxin family protein [Petrotogales bacterium]